MSRDTGPAELAELLQNDEKRKLWMILTLQEIKTDLAQHIVEDKAQFDELKQWKGSVSSSVGSLNAIKSKIEGGWATILSLTAIFVFLADIAFKVWEHFK